MNGLRRYIQDKLISGLNIKTVNGNSLLGPGNLTVEGGSFSGTMDDIPDGTTYVKTENNYTDSAVSKVAEVDNKLNLNGGNANTDIDINSYSFNAKSLHVKGTGGAGHLGLKHQSGSITATTNESTLGANSSGNPVWKNDGNAIQNLMLENAAISGATKTKITYDSKGLITSGADATTADIADSTNKRYVTDAQLTVIGNTSGSNTGDETTTTIKTKLGAASGAADGYLKSSDWTTFNGKQSALTNPVTGTGTNNEIAAFNSTGSTITSLTTATYPSLTELSYVKGVTSSVQTQLNGKEPTITNGFGLSGTSTKAVSLTNTSAFCTAETTISAVTYADISGASITLAAGTWLIMATINGASQTTTVAVMMAAITDGANTVIAESSQHIPAGTATVRTWGNINLSAIVAPSGSTTYKLRGARGTTTQTGNWIASDGNGVNTANNVSNNSDKGTVIMAVRIA